MAMVKRVKLDLSIGIRHRPNFCTKYTIWNSMDLIPCLKAVTHLFGSNIANRSRKSLNELRAIDIFIIDIITFSLRFLLALVIIHVMHYIISTNKSNRVRGYPLLITVILYHFEMDFSGEQVECVDNGDIISGSTLSRDGFEYNKKRKNSCQ